MHVARYTDPRAFLDRAQAWLMRAEVENNLILGISERLTSTPWTRAEPPYLATIEDDGAVVACALRTPPAKLVITRAPLDAVPREGTTMSLLRVRLR